MPKYTGGYAPRKKSGGIVFAIVMVVYAILFIAAAGYGLNRFWGFLESYEVSRPENTVNAYMSDLTDARILSFADNLIDQIDHNIQSQEECEEVILSFLSSDVSCARKSSASTETSQVYMLRCGPQVIGSFTITSGTPDENGFAVWSVTHEEFDFSFLLGTKVSISAPENYPVSINGVTLDESYIIGEEIIPFDVFDEFYEDYDLPKFRKVTYEAGPFLGDFEMSLKDLAGNPFVLDENTDLDAFIEDCPAATCSRLDGFLQPFLKAYVLFTGCANDSALANYINIKNYIVLGSDLDNRLKSALDGLQYAQSRGDTLSGTTVHHYVDLGGGKYLVDLTYLVDTTGMAGVVQTVNNVRLIIVETPNGLRTESITTY